MKPYVISAIQQTNKQTTKQINKRTEIEASSLLKIVYIYIYKLYHFMAPIKAHYLDKITDTTKKKKTNKQTITIIIIKKIDVNVVRISLKFFLCLEF